MSNLLTFVVFASLALAFGVVLGETYAPISGNTLQAIERRLTAAEGELEQLGRRQRQIDSACGSWLGTGDSVRDGAQLQK